MKKHIFTVMGPKMLQYGVALIVVGMSLSMLAGCNQPLKDNEILHSTMFFWPIFDIERWEWENPKDETRVKREVGDAAFWLSTWEKEEHFDRDDFPIYRKEHSAFFPLWSTEVEESEDFINKKGNILIFPYNSQQKK